MKDKSTLFVFYNLTKRHFWNYEQIPSSWIWTGKGSTTPIHPQQNADNSLYKKEEQFNGNSDNVDVMREYLDSFFSNLKSNGIVSNFKIEDDYNP